MTSKLITPPKCKKVKKYGIFQMSKKNYNMLQRIKLSNVDYRLLKNVIIMAITIHYFIKM